MSTTEQDALKLQIATEADNLGVGMRQAKEWTKDGWVTRLLRGVEVSEKAIIPVHVMAYKRAWLERDAAKDLAESRIELRTDGVAVDLRTKQALPYGTDGQIEAVLDPEAGVQIERGIDETLEQTLARLQQLGGYVAAIADAELHKQLRRAVPAHNMPSPRGTQRLRQEFYGSMAEEALEDIGSK